MPNLPDLLLVAALVLLLNLPFGFWRAGTRRFTLPWIAAVHAPVPLVIALRLAAGLGFHPLTFPFTVGAYFSGQFLGGRLRSAWAARRARPSPPPPVAPRG